MERKHETKGNKLKVSTTKRKQNVKNEGNNKEI